MKVGALDYEMLDNFKRAGPPLILLLSLFRAENESFRTKYF